MSINIWKRTEIGNYKIEDENSQSDKEEFGKQWICVLMKAVDKYIYKKFLVSLIWDKILKEYFEQLTTVNYTVTVFDIFHNYKF